MTVDPVVEHRTRDAGAPAHRLGERRNLAAAVGGQLHVVSEQHLERGEIALLGGRDEPSHQLVALLARRLEAGPALLDVASGAGGELAYVVLALADDLRDLRILVAEHIVEQQRGSLLRREALQQHQHRHRQRISSLRVLGRIILAVGDDRLWQPLTDIALATGAAERSSLIASRVVTVAMNARGDAICSPASSARCTRSSASCTTSSASDTLPSIRYAIANATGRSSSSSRSRSVMPLRTPHASSDAPDAKPARAWPSRSTRRGCRS